MVMDDDIDQSDSSSTATAVSHSKLNHDSDSVPPPPMIPSPLNHNHQSYYHPHQLLIRCAEFIDQSDFSSANQILSILQNNTYYYNFNYYSDRLIHLFTRALSVRLRQLSSKTFSPPTATISDHTFDQFPYLSLNQVTPFIRFSHLTANQAILEAIAPVPPSEISYYYESIHIIDFDILYGVQWPPLMQALADDQPHHPPTLRITGIGSDIQMLLKTGDRLTQFAVSLGLKFQFRPIILNDNDDDDVFASLINNNYPLRREALAVNCVHFLNRLLEQDNSGDRVGRFLRRVKSLNPKVLTLAEREADHSNSSFMGRFIEALGHYGAIFESLEATLPPTSRERMEVEQRVFGKEVIGIVVGDYTTTIHHRHQRFKWWEMAMTKAGFHNVGMTKFSVSQAKLLLRLHYPSEGYRVELLHDDAALFLGWKNRALFSISSWN